MESNKKVLIIGGTGFIGYHICIELIKQGFSATAISFDKVPEGFLPKSIEIVTANINNLSDEELAKIFAGHDYFIFAAGADDRIIPKAPAYDFFYNANVVTTKRVLTIAKASGVKKAVVMNSYFAYFDRIWPEMELAKKHPYIRTRKEQREVAFEVGGKDMPVAVMELPYIVGVAPTKVPLWKPLVKYVNTMGNLKFYTQGGTSVISVRNVAEAVVNAMQKTTENTPYAIGDVNMSWEKWLANLQINKSKKLKVISMPKFILKFAAFIVSLKTKLEGKESGLNTVPFIDLQTKNTYLPVEEMKKVLGYGSYDLNDDFKATIDESMK
jgi:nucleoside-diphosphate-sugar epimerase